MSETTILLPGDSIDVQVLPTAQKRKLGLGIKQDISSNDYTSTTAGILAINHRKKAAKVVSGGRYIPEKGDDVICQVRGASFETFHLYINAFSPQGILSHFSFEGASKKTRPQLKTGDVVYAKIVACQKNMDIELSCVNPNSGKAEGLGQLNDGMVFDVSLNVVGRLLRKELEIMEELGGKIPGGFEMIVGRNGRVWVDCAEAGVQGILAVGRILEMIGQGGLSEKEEKKFMNRMLKELGLG